MEASRYEQQVTVIRDGDHYVCMVPGMDLPTIRLAEERWRKLAEADSLESELREEDDYEDYDF